MKPSAKIILDSISEQGHRLTTMEVVMHRFILAEMNTHRAFSRNSASSRAIPFSKINHRVANDPASPVYWGAEQKGMQSGKALQNEDLIWCKDEWNFARGHAIAHAGNLHAHGLHKSLCNRLLEPFMWHTAIITATEWDNFFWQRCDPAAQPEMKAVADEMQRAYYTSTPTPLAHGEWHMPYIDRDNDVSFINKLLHAGSPQDPNKRSYLELTHYLKRISTARCARVSYLTHEGKRDVEIDLDLYGKLEGSDHWSPFEHVATPVRDIGSKDWYSSNFIGWKQFRKEFRNENRTNFIPNLPDLELQANNIRQGVPA